MIRYLLALLLCLTPSLAAAQTSYGTILNHRTTSDATVDQLCDKTRTTATCVPFMGIDNTQNIARAIDDKSAETVSVMDFCKKSQTTGLIDNQACIQAAVNDRCSKGGGVIHIPAGSYAISAASTVTIGCQGLYIKGDGSGDHTTAQGVTQINRIGSGSAPAFRWASTTFRIPNRYATGGGISDVFIWYINSNGAITQSGAAIEINKCEHCLVSGVKIWAPFIGIKTYAGYDNRVTETVINQVVAGGLGIWSVGSDQESGCSSDIGACTGRADILRIDNVSIDVSNIVTSSQHVADCITLQDFVATTWISHVACQQGRRGITAVCPNSAIIQACPAFITVFDFEHEGTDGGGGQNDSFNLLLLDTSHFVCVACQLFGYNVVANVSALNSRFTNAGDLQFIGGRIGYANQSCVVASVDQVFVGAGVNIQGCGKSGTGYYGVELRGPGVGGNTNSGTVQGVDFCRDPASPGTGVTNPMGAVRIGGAGGLTDYNIVTGNRFRGCGSGVTDSSGAAHNVTSGNVGP